MIKRRKLKYIKAREFSHDTNDTAALLREAADWLGDRTLTAIVFNNNLDAVGYRESIIVITEG